ncbi:411_t:CDS:2 [Ambispora gerdemannii]|uniref:411_t:CDS:1 n=1 Tax=Ambispora gerdemannii TaxID=144530 RepID=A0A9N9CBU3_9GLOM|nr:411_t:CDS:2 [Ambispora gerdemannii]
MNTRISTSKLLLVFLVIYGELLLSHNNVKASYLEARLAHRRGPLKKRGNQICSNSGVTCSGSNPCCSQFGWCGAGDGYCGTGCNPSATPSNLKKCLTGTTGKAVFPGDAEYAADIVDENNRVTYSPAALVYASDIADVQKAVKCAATSKLNVAPRSGGHSYESYSLGGKDGALVIDLGGLNQITIDDAAKTARIGAGSKLGPIYYTLSQSGYMIPGGSCPGVGISGFALGGGYGLYSRKFGLAVDNILSIDIVNADGDLITASSTKNSDLFFALRGAGGGSYGVVTSFKFKITPVQTQVTSFQYKWPVGAAKTLIPAIEKYATQGTDDVTLSLVWDNSGLLIQGVYLGQQSGLSNALSDILAVSGYNQVSVQQQTFFDSVVFFSGQSASFVQNPTITPYIFKAKSLYVDSSGLSAAGIDALNNYLASPPCHTYAILDLYGGAINRVAPNAMAFVHRDPLYGIQLMSDWQDASQKTKCVNNINSFGDSFQSRYTSPYSYQNYIDRDLNNWQNAYYGANYRKLVTTKAKYDKNNLFAFPQSIPTS